jgi:predicted nucleic acid-binding protein
MNCLVGGERLAITAPAMTGFQVIAFPAGGRRLAQALAFVSELEVLDVTWNISMDAARQGGECSRRGTPVGTIDLLIAATARLPREAPLGRERDFSLLPHLLLETY